MKLWKMSLTRNVAERGTEAAEVDESSVLTLPCFHLCILPLEEDVFFCFLWTHTTSNLTIITLRIVYLTLPGKTNIYVCIYLIVCVFN